MNTISLISNNNAMMLQHIVIKKIFVNYDHFCCINIHLYPQNYPRFICIFRLFRIFWIIIFPLMSSAYNFNLYIKATFSCSFECSLYTGLIVLIVTLAWGIIYFEIINLLMFLFWYFYTIFVSKLVIISWLIIEFQHICFTSPFVVLITQESNIQ